MRRRKEGRKKKKKKKREGEVREKLGEILNSRGRYRHIRMPNTIVESTFNSGDRVCRLF